MGWIRPFASGAKKVNSSIAPQIAWVQEIDGPRHFVKKFGAASAAEWMQALISATGTALGELPGYPDVETMRHIHGGLSVEHAMREAATLYQFILGHPSMQGFDFKAANILDFGCGWGRMHRPFMRHTPITQIFGYEPNLKFCILARRLNPYVMIYKGGFLPDGVLPAETYGLVFAWSVFSHLGHLATKSWLAELARISQPGAKLFLTTWGERFLHRLMKEEAEMKAGGEIDWYSQICIERGKDLESRLEEFRSGAFVHFPGDFEHYGETFLSRTAVEALLQAEKIPLKLLDVNEEALGQDALVLEKV